LKQLVLELSDFSEDALIPARMAATVNDNLGSDLPYYGQAEMLDAYDFYMIHP
jgi:hypothetical protein